jgi:hypothetical protein
MDNIKLYSKIAILPDELKKEADDFLEYLKMKVDEDTNIKKAGLAKGLIEMKENFDEPLEDFEEYMK